MKKLQSFGSRACRLAASGCVFAASTLGSLAAGTANTSAMGVIDDAKATFDAALVPALVILGTSLAIGVAVKIWHKVT